MKCWFVIDNETTSRSEIYVKRLPEGATFIQAARKANLIWSRKTPFEQKHCDELYIGRAASDEDGGPDYETMVDIVYIKN